MHLQSIRQVVLLRGILRGKRRKGQYNRLWFSWYCLKRQSRVLFGRQLTPLESSVSPIGSLCPQSVPIGSHRFLTSVGFPEAKRTLPDSLQFFAYTQLGSRLVLYLECIPTQFPVPDVSAH